MAITGSLMIAGPHDDGTIDRVKQHFERLLRTEVTLSVSYDESLIGGFIAFLDGRIYDCSLRSRVDAMQHQLAK